jgi:hypothetical protein
MLPDYSVTHHPGCSNLVEHADNAEEEGEEPALPSVLHCALPDFSSGATAFNGAAISVSH